MPYNNAIFEMCPASANRCRLTNNRSLIEQSDAIIFHIRDLNVASDMPTFRSAQQRWVFYIVESPPHTFQEETLKYLPQHYWFNWTFTYR